MNFETKTASNGTTTIIRFIGLQSGDTTSFQFKASDPFLSKTKISESKIKEWPVEIHMTPAGIEQFEDASRTHLAGALKADDQNYFRLFVANGDIVARFESRAGKIEHRIGSSTSSFQGESVYSIPQFRSALSALGPDGGFLKIAEPAISIVTETASSLYTFVLTKKIIR